MINSIQLFTDPDECLAFLLKLQQVKVFLIVSSNIGDSFISLVHDLSQLASVYIYGGEKILCEPRLTEKIKIKNVSNDISLICDQLKRNLRQCQQDLLPISIISSRSATNLNELDPSFMYSQLLKEILIKMEYTDKAKSEFIQFCRVQYTDNSYQIHLIDDFERDYNLHSPIWWYTKESFIYAMLNKALRTHDIEVIINMGYFIRNLHQQIEQLHLQAKCETSFMVYRGQGIFNNEFKNMINSKGGLLSFNSFLSTSLDGDVSLLFANSSRADPNLTGILFEMEINPRISSASFVSLGSISYYPDEKEVLFSMHTVFRIGDMEQMEDRLWKVKLILTSDIDEQFTQLTKQMREEIKGETEWDQLGLLMHKMGEFTKSEHIYRTLVDTTSDGDLEKLALRQYQLGSALFYTGDLQSALSYFEKTRAIQEAYFSCNYQKLCAIYNGFGMVHSSLGNCSAALSYFERVVELTEKIFPPDCIRLATVYNNLGWANYLLDNCPTAISYCEKALTFLQESTLSTHPIFATIHDSIGRIYYTMKNYSNALIHYEKSLEINRKSRPSNHPMFAADYLNIGEVYYSMGEYQTALSFYQKTFEIRQKTYSTQHPDIGVVYNSIGNVYHAMLENSIALDYFNKALNIFKISLPLDHPQTIATSKILLK